MTKWTKRHDNRRRLSQAAHLIDNAIEHLVVIHDSYPEGYEAHQKVLKVYSVALDDMKREILAYRADI